MRRESEWAIADGGVVAEIHVLPCSMEAERSAAARPCLAISRHACARHHLSISGLSVWEWIAVILACLGV
jgi:hypothetical protein